MPKWQRNYSKYSWVFQSQWPEKATCPEGDGRHQRGVLRKGNWSRKSCPEGNTVRASSLLLGDLGCFLWVSELLLIKTRLGRASLHLPYTPKKQKGVRSFMCHCLVDKTLEQIVPEVFGAGSRLPEGRNQRSQLDGKEVVPKYCYSLKMPNPPWHLGSQVYTKNGLSGKQNPPKKTELGNLLLFHEAP